MIAIPNMEKPKSCWECRLMDGEANCLVTDEGISSKQEGIHPDCPLIEIVTCGECIHFHYDKPYIIQGIPVLGHEVCDFWGDGCKTNPNGFCSYGERK